MAASRPRSQVGTDATDPRPLCAEDTMRAISRASCRRATRRCRRTGEVE